MSLLAIAVIRGVVGLCLVAVAIAMIVYSFVGEGAGCLNGIILGLIFLICVIVVNVMGSDDAVSAFFGTDSWNVMGGLLVVAVGCLYFSMSKIAGVLSSIAVGYTGLLVTGFLAADQVAILSEGVLDMGVIIMLPIALPIALLVILIGIIFK